MVEICLNCVWSTFAFTSYFFLGGLTQKVEEKQVSFCHHTTTRTPATGALFQNFGTRTIWVAMRVLKSLGL